MRITKPLLIVATIIIASASVAASNNDDPDASTPLLAKLSYKAQEQNLMPRADLCISVWQDGHYRMLRNGDLVGPTLVRGVLSAIELKQLKFLLDTPDFRALSDARGDQIRKEFAAEVPRGKEIQHLVLVIPDEVQSFPKSAEDVIVWLREFQPRDAESLTYTKYRDVCPRINVSPFVPVAENLGFTTGDSCVTPSELPMPKAIPR